MKAGRLFWKFFFIFWLAQLVTTLGVGMMMWLHRPEFQPPHPVPAGANPPPPPRPGMPPPPRPGMPPPPRPGMPLPLLPLLSGGVVSLLFAAGLAWYFAYPIRSLGKAFDDVAAGKLDARVDARLHRRRDEFADLGAGFDHMAARLQELLDGQRRLLHDVSHELRSPLARLQAAADLMRQQPERAPEFLERIQRDTGRMDRLVGELLTLARLDAGMAGDMSERVDLGALMDDIANDEALEAQGKDCRIEVDVPEGLAVAGSGDMLRRALENVVRNALRHSPRAGTVRLTARADAGGEGVGIAIEDQGPGVPEDQLKAIFEPFVRGEGSRGAGYGLGLAITRRAVAAHGGSVVARNLPGGGLSVVLRLPSRLT